MPYKTVSELPAQFNNLPNNAKRIAMNVINSTLASGDSEESAFKQAWAQVKKSYKKVGDKWVAKEAVMLVKEKMSADDKRNIIQAALNEKYPRDSQAYPYSPSPWIRDIYEETVVYDLGGSNFEVGYTMTPEGKVTLGEETKKVIAQTVYTGIESLREKYAELIQEAGERGVSMDNLKEVAETCSTLIDTEEPDEDAVNEALSGTGKALEWIRLQEANKTEDGQSYPASAFAYVPDPDKPSTWKLRLWEDPEKKVTRAQLGRAAAALSPGGFRGNRVQIPSNALAGVKAKIRAAYKKLGVEDEDIPKWVKEAEEMRQRVEESCEIDIEEVTKEGIAKGIVPVRIIVPGFNSSETRYYSEQAVSDAAEIFDSAKMYADHATESEEKEKPERSIRDWVATLHDTKVSESGNAVGMAHINAGWLKDKISNLYEQGDLQHLGTSINAIGKGTNQTIEGKKTVLVEGLIKSTFQSVDFVTEAGAGGQAGMRESVRGSLDIDLMDLAQLREARPDLVASIEADTKESIRQEVKEAMEATKELEDLTKQVDTLTTENGELKEQIKEAEKEKAKAEAQALIKEAVDKAELPDAAKTRLTLMFAEATTDEGVEEAIKAEVDYVKTIKGDGKVKGLGDSKPEGEAGKKALSESMKKAHPDWTDEQLAIAVKGR